MTATESEQNIIQMMDPALRQGSGVRLGTLIMIRWMAVAGQMLSLLTVHYILGFDIRPELTFTVVFISGMMNLWFSLREDLNTRLTDKQSTWHMVFDLLHLSTLLFLTGGLSNPFIVLMLAPSSVSASILSPRSTKVLIAISVVLVTALAYTPFPLPWKGQAPEVDMILKAGIWISLCFTLIFLAMYMARVSKEGRDRANALAATQAALEQEQRLAALGTLAAAAAHELGTPLGTILLVAKELQNHCQDKDEQTKLDIDLIIDQTTRCREILAEISQKRKAGDAEHFTYLGIEAILREAGHPHEMRGVKVKYTSEGPDHLIIRRTPEQIHAFRTIVENATGFASHEVHVHASWDEDQLQVYVEDDGPGFDPQVIKRLGEPYVTTRQPTPGKDGGLGLGLFISKTLLERTGAKMSFKTASIGGARVELNWPRSALIEEPAFSDEEEFV